ncbi:MAG: ExbD/TolR family protein [bacterium]
MNDINITPLVDVLLVLVVALIIAAPFITQSLPVKLPKGALQYRLPEFSEALLISVDAQGTYQISQEQNPKLQEALLSPSLSELVRFLASQDSSVREHPVHIQMDERLPHGKLIELMLELQNLGFPQVGLVFQDQGKKSP